MDAERKWSEIRRGAQPAGRSAAGRRSRPAACPPKKKRSDELSSPDRLRRRP